MLATLKDVLSNIDVKQVDKLVLSLEKAEKWKYNLYNWKWRLSNH